MYYAEWTCASWLVPEVSWAQRRWHLMSEIASACHQNTLPVVILFDLHHRWSREEPFSPILKVVLSNFVISRPSDAQRSVYLSRMRTCFPCAHAWVVSSGPSRRFREGWSSVRLGSTDTAPHCKVSLENTSDAPRVLIEIANKVWAHIMLKNTCLKH